MCVCVWVGSWVGLFFGDPYNVLFDSTLRCICCWKLLRSMSIATELWEFPFGTRIGGPSLSGALLACVHFELLSWRLQKLIGRQRLLHKPLQAHHPCLAAVSASLGLLRRRGVTRILQYELQLQSILGLERLYELADLHSCLSTVN